MIRWRLGDERGWAVVTALLVLVIMLGIGLALLSTVGVQSHQSATERAGEGSFGLADAALENTANQLGRVWPATAPSAGAPACNQSANPTPGCIGSGLTSNYTTASAGADFASMPNWKVQIVDDVNGPSYYSDSLATSAPHWDANGDRAVWLRAEAVVRGQKRIVVALARTQPAQIFLPKNTITAGAFGTDNNGSKVIVYTQNPQDSNSLTGPIAVRCGDTSTTPSTSSSCLNYDRSKGQVSPTDSFVAGYADPSGASKTLLDPATLDELRDYAKSTPGGVYAPSGTCPSTLQGPIVYIENANCDYNGGTVNSPTYPGGVVIRNGTLSLGGNISYYGLIYAANEQGTVPGSGPCTPAYQNPVISEHGTALIQGAVFIDKCGTIGAGASKVNVVFDVNAFGALKAFGPATLVKGSFRIVPNS